MQDQKRNIIIDYKKCLSCGICVSLCPHKAIEMVNGYPQATGTCKVCGLCAGSCITNAISMFATKFRDETIIEEISTSNLIPCRRKSKEGVTLLCISRLDMIHLAEAIARHGSVAVLSCENDCRNSPGAFEVRSKIKAMQIALSKLGLEKERIAFNEKARNFGSISSEKAELLKAVARDRNVRALVSKMRTITEVGNVYGEKISTEKYEQILSDAIETAINMAKILKSVDKEAKVSQIAEKSGMERSEVVSAIVEMRRRGLVEILGEDELTIRVVK